MKFSLHGTTSYTGSTPGFEVWPNPPGYCDRELAGRNLKEQLDLYRYADEAGFDWVSVAEHHYSPMTMTPSPIVMASAMGQLVKRAKVAVLGPVVPLVNPVRLAEEIAFLDQLTDGRVVVMLLGGTPQERKTYGSVADTRQMTQEGIALIRKAWTEPEPFDWHGEHFTFPQVAAWPRPRQEPHPPIFGSGNSEESAIFAARNHIGIAMSFLPLARVRTIVELYRTEAERAGWSPTPDHVLFRGFAHLAESDSAASDELAEAHRKKAAQTEASLSRFRGVPTPYAPDPKHPLLGPYFLGGPESVLKQVRALFDAGVGILDVGFSSWVFTSDERQRTVELFVQKVLPRAQQWN